MASPSFSLTLKVKESPEIVFDAVNNVSSWWSEEIEGSTHNAGDEFAYHYKDVHRCKMKIIEFVPSQKVVWLVLDNYFSFTKNKSEWTGTKIIFDITSAEGETTLQFTHAGLVPEDECYVACSNGWSQYIQQSLYKLITTGKGQPNSSETALTTHEVAARFYELAKKEQWFEIQDEFFSDDVKSIEPAGAQNLHNAEGKAAVRKKGEDWISRIEGLHRAFTTEPVVGGSFFSVGRELDITVQGLGRIQTDEIMLYEVKNGKIISEQFFY